jgi:hypothetical protein
MHLKVVFILLLGVSTISAELCASSDNNGTFYLCDDENIKFVCPSNTVFNKTTSTCDWPSPMVDDHQNWPVGFVKTLCASTSDHVNDLTNCSNFFYCHPNVFASNNVSYSRRPCALGTFFDFRTRNCDYTHKVPSCSANGQIIGGKLTNYFPYYLHGRKYGTIGRNSPA